MIRSFSRRQTATAVLEVDSVVPPDATCPLCHTTELSLSGGALAAGGEWRCVRCGQRWDARRLETVAAYAGLAADGSSRPPA
jgi:transposase-like protein